MRPGLCEYRPAQIEHRFENSRSAGRSPDLPVSDNCIQNSPDVVGREEWSEANYQCSSQHLRMPPSTGTAVKLDGPTDEFTSWIF